MKCINDGALHVIINGIRMITEQYKKYFCSIGKILLPAEYHSFYCFSFSLFTWSKQQWLFWRACFYPANHSNLKRIQKTLIGWKKAGPPKKPLLFWSCKQANYTNIRRAFQISWLWDLCMVHWWVFVYSKNLFNFIARKLRPAAPCLAQIKSLKVIFSLSLAEL